MTTVALLLLAKRAAQRLSLVRLLEEVQRRQAARHVVAFDELECDGINHDVHRWSIGTAASLAASHFCLFCRIADATAVLLASFIKFPDDGWASVSISNRNSKLLWSFCWHAWRPLQSKVIQTPFVQALLGAPLL